MKAYTDIEQSKKLAEILPLESADMIWVLANPDLPMIRAIAYEDSEKSKYYEILPAWSLAALLSVIPSGKALIHDKGNLGYKCICNNMDTYFHDNPVDVCVEMILKLKEENHI